MPKPGRTSAAGNTLSIAGCGLEVRFNWTGDRYAHSVWDVRGPEVCLLSSLEGKLDQSWPPSPPLQQFHIEHRPTGDVALLVGMAGSAHWSASFGAGAPDGALLVQAACRSKAVMGALGSSYRAIGAAKILLDQTACAIEMTACKCLLDPGLATRLLALEDCAWGVRFAPELIECVNPHTVQWSYGISLNVDR